MSRLQFLAIYGLLCSSLSTAAGERIDLSCGNEAGQLTHVTIQLDAGGHNLVRTEPSQPSEKSAGAEQSLPSSVAAKLAYDEKRIASGAPKISLATLLAVRYYDQAEAVIKVGESGRTPKLSDDKRVLVLEQGQQRPVVFCPGNPLSREQFDLIDTVGDAFQVDRLLPKQPVAVGDSWANDESVMCPLLTLDTVAVCEVQSILDEYNANFAKVRLAGDVHGSADGAATQQEVRGVYLFDRKLRRITRINLAIREKRSIGGATPGLDAVAKVQIKIDPIGSSPHLSDEVVAKSTNAARTPLYDLVFESPTLGFRVKHDRQWYVTADGREAVTLRRVEGGDVVGQCTISALPPKSAGRQTSLEQFQKDIQFSLGKNFGELVSSRQYQNAAGLYCYEVIVRGLVEELPVEWHYYLLTPESGNRVSAAVTIEKPMLDRMGHADRDLVESLQLIPVVPAETAATVKAPPPR